MVLSSTQSARCSGDHLPRDTRSSLSSTHFVRDWLLGIGVLGNHAVHEVQSGVQQRIREDGGRVAPEVVGSTARPAAELAIRHPHVIAHPPVIDMPRAIELACCTPWCSVQANPRLTASFRWVSLCSSIRRIPSSRPSDDPRRPPTVSGPNRRQSLTDAPASLLPPLSGQRRYGHQNHPNDSFGTGFRGCPTKYARRERLSNPWRYHWSTVPSSEYRRWSRVIAHSSPGSKAVDQGGGCTSSAATRRTSECCTTSG